MKKKILNLTGTILVLSLLMSSSCIAKTSEIKKENRKVGDFVELSMAIPANLYLTQGDKCEVIIEADEDLLGKIETEVKGGELELKFEKWYNYRGTGSINVYVTVKDIKKLVVSGSGDIVSKTAIHTEKISIIVTGSGSVLIDKLSAKSVYAMISGSGDIKVGGTKKSQSLNATVTGSGDIETYNLEFVRADLTITGSGSIRAFVSEELDATITGSGRIYYKGKPIIDANITGSGKIKSEE